MLKALAKIRQRFRQPQIVINTTGGYIPQPGELGSPPTEGSAIEKSVWADLRWVDKDGCRFGYDDNGVLCARVGNLSVPAPDAPPPKQGPVVAEVAAMFRREEKIEVKLEEPEATRRRAPRKNVMSHAEGRKLNDKIVSLVSRRKTGMTSEEIMQALRKISAYEDLRYGPLTARLHKLEEDKRIVRAGKRNPKNGNGKALRAHIVWKTRENL